MSVALKIRTQPVAAPAILGDPYSVFVIKEGYAYTGQDGNTRADGSITLVKGPRVVMVDTGNPWDREVILQSLARHGLEPKDVSFVVCTHGHSDHVGNLNLFPDATFIVSYDICRGDIYLSHDFRAGLPFTIDEHLEVFATPGHCGSDVSVLVRGTEQGTVVVCGDLFEREGDDGSWQQLSEDPQLQAQHREKILFPAIHIHATGGGGCCANRCGMFLSILFAALGALGSGYCLITSILGLVNGPTCEYNNGNWTRPFSGDLDNAHYDLEDIEKNYLFHPEIWNKCTRPDKVVVFNVILFSLLIGFSAIELILCGIQMFNGLLGCLCGTCGKRGAGPV
uniref:metallo-beta-lactamase domain-containing protein 1-like isoform X2 n=1 Tax=Pristiophorus japonicus TaxID=55135 RepID=UPI00398EB698